MTGRIFDIKEFALHDGPGIRTTVFFKGCPLKCRWCHNPEGLSPESQLMFKSARCMGCGNCRKECQHPDCKPFGRCIHACPENCLEISGRTVTSEELASELEKSAASFGGTFGGFTFSGGEPLAQPKFLLELLDKLKDYHLLIETSGHATPDIFRAVIDKLDSVIMDIKLADSMEHKKYTGVGNELILENYKILKACGTPHIIRTPLIPNITDGEENLNKIKDLIGDSKWEKLPYNSMAAAKYEMLGMPWRMGDNYSKT